MKITAIFTVGVFALAMLSTEAQTAQIVETTFEDWTNWDSTGGALTFQGTNTFDNDGVTVNGINNPSAPGAAGTGGSLEISPIVPCNWGQAGPAFGLSGVTTALLQAMDGAGAGYGSPMVAQSGTLLVKYTKPDFTNAGTFFNFGIFFQDNVQWGGWSASQTVDLGPVTTPSGTEELFEAVIPYTLNTNSSLAFAQMGLWLFTDYQGANPWYIDNISVVPIYTPPTPPTPTSLFTTSNDFALFNPAGGDFVEATNDWTWDINATNGLGDTNAPGAMGTSGSLLLYWSSLESSYGSIADGSDEEFNAAFMQAIDPGCNPGSETSVAAYGKIFMDYSQPDNSGGGSYFQVGINLSYNADGYYGAFFPRTVRDLNIQDNNGYEVYEATIPYTINPGYFYGFTPHIVINSDYQPTNGFHIDNITVSAAQAPLITGVSLNGNSVVIQGTNGLVGFNYNLLSTTNLSSTNSWNVAAPGVPFIATSFAITNSIDPGARQTFYKIQTVAP